MTKTTKQTSKSGDGSNVLQAETINIGVSYSEAREISLDVFNANITKFTTEAANIAAERVDIFTTNLVQKLKERGILSIEGLKDPGFQYSLFEAQKNYAKTGDKDMGDVLVDILIDRMNQKERNLKQIVLDESVNVVPKLTSSQLDIITIIFLLKYSRINGIKNFIDLKEYILTYLDPFIGNLSKESSIFQHIEFTGCGSISLAGTGIEDLLSSHYQGLFFEGIEEIEFERDFTILKEYAHDFIIPCLNNEKRVQINTLNLDTLNETIDKLKIEDEPATKLRELYGRNKLTKEKVQEKVISLCESMKVLFHIWEISEMKHLTLTTVGIAIAQANFRRKTGITFDLSIWIK